MINDYISTLSKSYYLNLIEGDNGNEEEDNFASIPFSFVGENKGADDFKKSCKFIIRNSIEYKNWVKWFKDNYGPPICCISNHTVTIEVHHHPLVLEDYFDIALSYIYNHKLTYTTALVADLILRWHYDQKVCGCFLSKTEHKNFHDNHDKIIPEESIYGNLKDFILDPIAREYINEYHLSKIMNYMPDFYQKNKDLFDKFDLNNVMDGI